MKILDRVRASQFGIPALMVVASVALAAVTNLLDDAAVLVDSPLVLPASRGTAQDLLSTVATSTITVAAIVFSVTAVVSQLSATQYSPRVLQGFLDDRYQQVVLGMVGGTYTFALVGEALISGDLTANGGNLTATVGMVLGVLSVVAIIGLIGRVTARVRVDDTIARIADQTTHEMMAMFDHDDTAIEDGAWSIAGDVPSAPVVCSVEGWVHRINVELVLDRLPEGAIVRVDTAVGEHITQGHRVATVWHRTDPEGTAEQIAGSLLRVRINRSIEGDPGFGFRQLVDIALRALSPAINDPNTAADVIRSMVKPLQAGMLGDHPVRARHGAGGRSVYLPREPDWRDFFLDSFRRIRLASARHTIVGEALLSAVGALAEQAGDNNIDAICDEAHRIGREIQGWQLDPHDERATLAPLARFDQTRDLHQSLVRNE